MNTLTALKISVLVEQKGHESNELLVERNNTNSLGESNEIVNKVLFGLVDVYPTRLFVVINIFLHSVNAQNL